MKNISRVRRAAGFSLIEVLIALVVLSFGLLALAALQTSIFKASTEARSQSVALGLAGEKLEFFRGYDVPTDYAALTGGSDAAAIAIGGINYTREWTVARYAFPSATTATAFQLQGSNTAALSSTYIEDNEFKRVVVKVSWTDAQGMSRQVSLEDAIAAIDPGDSAKIGKLNSGAVSRGPEKRIYNPATLQEGVIPIAYGSGDTNTAATNPKPLVNGSNVLETRFDVLTYASLNTTLGTAVEQARVETSVVGCSCDYATAPTSSTARGKRPTYWDGSRYVTPEDTTYVPKAGVKASVSNQSDLCNVCCRDHHDPSTLVAGSAKFDPRNSSHSSGHFQMNGSTGVLGAQALTGEYTEVCRVIRVDGFFRVAADAFGDYVNLLDTNSVASTPDTGKSAYVPTAAATTKYQNFVKDYLDARVVSSDSADDTATTLNSVLATNVTATSALEVAKINSVSGSISVQDQLTFSKTDESKWLHMRGLYIDYLEDAAVQAIIDAKDNCVGTGTAGAVTADDLESCVLSVLPFTSINLTELANWTPTSGSQIVVAGNNYSFASTLTATEPVRGKVIYGSNPTNSQVTDALASMRRSNSGLTTLVSGIDTDDAQTAAPFTWTASQPFSMSGFGSSTSGGSFTVTLASTGSGYTYAASNVVNQYINSSLTGTTCNYAASGDPVTCTSSSALGVPQTLTVGRYNYSSTVKTNSSSTLGAVSLTCTTTSTSGATTTRTFPSNPGKTINVCKNYAVTASNGGGVVGTVSPSDGVLTESTVIFYASMIDGAAVVLNLQPQTDTYSYTCTFGETSAPSQDSKYTVTAKTCP